MARLHRGLRAPPHPGIPRPALHLRATERRPLAAELPADGYRNFGYAGGRTVYRTRVPLPAQPGPKPPSGGTVDLVPADPPPFEERYFLYDWHAAGSPARGTTTPLPYAHEDDALGWLTQVKPTPGAASSASTATAGAAG
ncbi:MAG: hypothetical protein H6710_01940 [Myxococcales bacterium]|nr:hypothetical protein [Myxococcales bacterium]